MDNGQKYQVHCSRGVAEKLVELQQSVSPGERVRFADAFEKIVKGLQTHADEFGEPLYHLPNLHMQVRTAVVLPLSVEFAVCEDRPLVFIKIVRLLAPRV